MSRPTQISTLRTDEISLVPEVWTSSWGHLAHLYPLDDRVWRERLAAHHEPELLLGARSGGRLVGVAYGRLPTAPWLPADVGWVSLLAVSREWQGKGAGGQLLRELLARLRAGGAQRFRLGTDANHLLPGPPQESSPALWRLARRANARFLAAEHDLHVDLTIPLPPAPLPGGWQVRTDTPQAAVRFVEAAFPGRWAAEVASYAAAGATLLTLERTADSLTAGFCALFTGREAMIGPSLYWQGALTDATGPSSEPAAGPADVPRLRVPAGMGPLGVSPELRGSGLGVAMVRAGAAWLQERGATDMIINWTTLAPFYGRVGARVWRTYQRVEGPT